MGFRVVKCEEDAIFNMERSKRAVAVREKLGHRGGKHYQCHPSTSDRLYTDEEAMFFRAIEAFKVNSGRMFPTLSEILGVLKSMGYSRVA